MIRLLALEDRYPAVKAVTDIGRNEHRQWLSKVFAGALKWSGRSSPSTRDRFTRDCHRCLHLEIAAPRHVPRRSCRQGNDEVPHPCRSFSNHGPQLKENCNDSATQLSLHHLGRRRQCFAGIGCRAQAAGPRTSRSGHERGMQSAGNGGGRRHVRLLDPCAESNRSLPPKPDLQRLGGAHASGSTHRRDQRSVECTRAGVCQGRHR